MIAATLQHLTLLTKGDDKDTIDKIAKTETQGSQLGPTLFNICMDEYADTFT